MSYPPPPVHPRFAQLYSRGMSLICGILTFICLGPIAGIAAIILGHLSLSEIRRSGGVLQGHGMAVAGLAMGYVGSAVFAAAIATAFLPTVVSIREAGPRAQAQTAEQGIVAALKSYQTEYGLLPGDLGATSDRTFSADNRELFAVLRGKHADNPRAIVFFEGRNVKDELHPRNGFDSKGTFYDPWGHPYFIRLDSNHDGVVDDPLATSPTAQKIALPVIVWSLGPPKAFGSSSVQKSVLSWR